MKWLRLWAEMLDDAAVQQLRLAAFKLWIDLLCVVGEADGAAVTVEQLAFRTRTRKTRCQTALDELLEARLIVSRNGKVKPRNWHRFQYKSDDISARVKRYRERDETVHVTPPETEERRGEKKRVDPERPRPHFDEASEQFLAAQPNERVGRLVDVGDALGFERNGGMAAAIVKQYGHGRSVIEAMVSGLSARGDKWEYTKGVLRNGKSKQAGRGGSGKRTVIDAAGLEAAKRYAAGDDSALQE